MTKNILLICEHHRIDDPLRRSVGHLTKCCQITVIHNGYDFFEQLSATAFDLVIIDFEISGFDGLELVESVHYIDPGVPVILMLEREHQAIWSTARQLKAHPIVRPFKPLKFLRLVDKLLHQHLNYYRKLTAILKTMLESFRTQAAATCAFLVDENGEILIASGDVAGITPGELGRLTADSFVLEDAESQGLQYPLVQD